MKHEHNLTDWQDHRDDTIGVTIDAVFDRIDLNFRNGAALWVEYEDGRIRVHCYRPGLDEPVSVELYNDHIAVHDDTTVCPFIFLETRP